MRTDIITDWRATFHGFDRHANYRPLICLPGAAIMEQPCGNQAIWEMSAKYLGMSAVLAVIALMLLALPSRADEQRVRIPDGCRELADRAGLPLTLTHAEARRAIAYLSIMSSQEPAVVRCRMALHG